MSIGIPMTRSRATMPLVEGKLKGNGPGIANDRRLIGKPRAAAPRPVSCQRRLGLTKVVQVLQWLGKADKQHGQGMDDEGD